uniref:Uncharacterized protein n=1 Tax=Cuerna arida TaxID=1464854 RepID=A0A1B6FPK6_9HEMI
MANMYNNKKINCEECNRIKNTGKIFKIIKSNVKCDNNVKLYSAKSKTKLYDKKQSIPQKNKTENTRKKAEGKTQNGSLKSDVTVSYCVTSPKNTKLKINPESQQTGYRDNQQSLIHNANVAQKKKGFEVKQIPLDMKYLELSIKQSRCPMVVNVHEGLKDVSDKLWLKNFKVKKDFSDSTKPNQLKLNIAGDSLRDLQKTAHKYEQTSQKKKLNNSKKSKVMSKDLLHVKFSDKKTDLYHVRIKPNDTLVKKSQVRSKIQKKKIKGEADKELSDNKQTSFEHRISRNHSHRDNKITKRHMSTGKTEHGWSLFLINDDDIKSDQILESSLTANLDYKLSNNKEGLRNEHSLQTEDEKYFRHKSKLKYSNHIMANKVIILNASHSQFCKISNFLQCESSNQLLTHEHGRGEILQNLTYNDGVSLSNHKSDFQNCNFGKINKNKQTHSVHNLEFANITSGGENNEKKIFTIKARLRKRTFEKLNKNNIRETERSYISTINGINTNVNELRKSGKTSTSIDNDLTGCKELINNCKISKNRTSNVIRSHNSSSMVGEGCIKHTDYFSKIHNKDHSVLQPYYSSKKSKSLTIVNYMEKYLQNSVQNRFNSNYKTGWSKHEVPNNYAKYNNDNLREDRIFDSVHSDVNNSAVLNNRTQFKSHQSTLDEFEIDNFSYKSNLTGYCTLKQTHEGRSDVLSLESQYDKPNITKIVQLDRTLNNRQLDFPEEQLLCSRTQDSSLKNVSDSLPEVNPLLISYSRTSVDVAVQTEPVQTLNWNIQTLKSQYVGTQTHLELEERNTIKPILSEPVQFFEKTFLIDDNSNMDCQRFPLSQVRQDEFLVRSLKQPPMDKTLKFGLDSQPSLVEFQERSYSKVFCCNFCKEFTKGNNESNECTVKNCPDFIWTSQLNQTSSAELLSHENINKNGNAKNNPLADGKESFTGAKPSLLYDANKLNFSDNKFYRSINGHSDLQQDETSTTAQKQGSYIRIGKIPYEVYKVQSSQMALFKSVNKNKHKPNKTFQQSLQKKESPEIYTKNLQPLTELSKMLGPIKSVEPQIVYDPGEKYSTLLNSKSSTPQLIIKENYKTDNTFSFPTNNEEQENLIPATQNKLINNYDKSYATSITGLRLNYEPLGSLTSKNHQLNNRNEVENYCKNKDDYFLDLESELNRETYHQDVKKLSSSPSTYSYSSFSHILFNIKVQEEDTDEASLIKKKTKTSIALQTSLILMPIEKLNHEKQTYNLNSDSNSSNLNNDQGKVNIGTIQRPTYSDKATEIDEQFYLKGKNSKIKSKFQHKSHSFIKQFILTKKSSSKNIEIIQGKESDLYKSNNGLTTKEPNKLSKLKTNKIKFRKNNDNFVRFNKAFLCYYAMYNPTEYFIKRLRARKEDGNIKSQTVLSTTMKKIKENLLKYKGFLSSKSKDSSTSKLFLDPRKVTIIDQQISSFYEIQLEVLCSKDKLVVESLKSFYDEQYFDSNF